MPQVRYVEVSPEPTLAGRIECLWSIEIGADDDLAPRRVFPDGCIELIVKLGPSWLWRGEKGEFVEQPQVFFVGQLVEPLWLRPAANSRTWAARMRPGGAFGLLGDHLDVSLGAVVPLERVWSSDAAALASAMRTAPPDAQAVVFQAALRSRAAQAAQAHPAVRAAVDAIVEARGMVTIASLAAASGWSERQFTRRFAREVGCHPRQLARTVRFQHLLKLIGDDPRIDWAGLAWDSGFADQAHLIREFRRFTGATPGSFADEALALARQFVSPERLERYFQPPRS